MGIKNHPIKWHLTKSSPRELISHFSILFIALLVLVASATFYQVKFQLKESPRVLEQLLLAFSIKYNLNYLSVNKKSDEIKSVNGIRCLFSYMIYITHFGIVFFNYGFINKSVLSEITDNFMTIVVSNIKLYNVAFLTISGMLATYSFLKRLDDRKKLSYFKEISGRLLR